MRDMFDFMVFVFGVIASIILLFFLLALGFYYGGTKPACEQYGRLEAKEISTQFFGAGCLVKYEGRWVDYSVAVEKKQEIKVTK